MFKEKIVLELMKQNPGLSKKLAEGIADKLAPTITEETQIEGKVTELNNGPISLKDLLAEGDRRATDAVNTYKAQNPPPTPPGGTPPPNPGTPPANPPAGETAVEKQLREMSEKLAAMERKELVSSKKESLIAKLKEKGIPASMANSIVLDENTDLDTAITGIETNFNEIKQSLNIDSFQQNSFIPGVGGNGGKLDQTAVSADIANWAKDQVPAPAEPAK